MSTDQVELERTTAGQASQRAESGVKTILLHVQNDKSLDCRFETALSLARACEAHLTCLHVTPIEAYAAFDNFGGVFVMNDVVKALDEEEAKLRAKVEQDLRKEDVSWDYIQVTGNITGQILGHAALADLVVTGREPRRADFSGPAIGTMGDLLYRARTPLFIPGDQNASCDPTGVALIAWNGSIEAANAVRSTIGLLKIASDVRVLRVTEEEDEAFPPTKLLEYLSRHGIHAEMIVEPAPRSGGLQEFVSGSLMSHAAAVKAAYIVMGGYGHSRVGEYVFGGVTRTLLNGCPVPLVIAH